EAPPRPARGGGRVRGPHGRLGGGGRAGLVRPAPLPAAVRDGHPRPRAELRPRPGARRGGDPHRVALPAVDPLAGGRGRLDAAPAAHGPGHRGADGGRSLHARRPRRPGDQHPLRLLVPPPPHASLPWPAERPRPDAGGLQRRPVQRRPLDRPHAAGNARRDRLRRDARLHHAGPSRTDLLPHRLETHM
ncbi:MAG: GH23, partial [uncultured Thermoleophilia bacterium]